MPIRNDYRVTCIANLLTSPGSDRVRVLHEYWPPRCAIESTSAALRRTVDRQVIMTNTPIFSKQARVLAVSALISLLAHGQAFALAANEKDLGTACKKAKSFDEFNEVFGSYSERKYSKEDLTCAVKVAADFATSKPKEGEMSVVALTASIDLLDLLSSILDGSPYNEGPEALDLSVRWKYAVKRGQESYKRLTSLAPKDPNAGALKVAFDLLRTSRYAPQDQMVQVAAEALPRMQEYVKKDPRLLNGLGEMMLGRMLLSLPESSGGDQDAAIVHLKRSVEIDPKSLVHARWLAEAYIALQRNDEVIAALKPMLNIKPIEGAWQQYADELRAGAGLAARAGDAALSEQLKQMRDQFLAKHPEVLTRKSLPQVGHGGANPLTGKHEE
jgi:tetratricopeptide (TPR) repeat protein